MPGYYLPPSVYVCFTADGTVFLDSKRDEYVGLDKADTVRLHCILASGEAGDALCAPLREQLLSAGLLTTNSSEGRPFAPTSVAIATTLLVEVEPDVSPPLRPYLLPFLRACVTAWVALRCGSLHYAVTRLRRRKRSRTNTPRLHFDKKRAQEFVTAFQILRAFIYVARQNCLYDSLVLAEFLRLHDVPAECVFGVKTLPFRAHCWVQTGSYVALSEVPEALAGFVPILEA